MWPQDREAYMFSMLYHKVEKRLQWQGMAVRLLAFTLLKAYLTNEPAPPEVVKKLKSVT